MAADKAQMARAGSEVRPFGCRPAARHFTGDRPGTAGPPERQVGPARQPPERQVGPARQAPLSGRSARPGRPPRAAGRPGPAGPSERQVGPAGPPERQVGPAGPPERQVGPAGPPERQVGPASPPERQVGGTGAAAECCMRMESYRVGNAAY